jgi:hypothetical protein
MVLMVGILPLFREAIPARLGKTPKDVRVEKLDRTHVQTWLAGDARARAVQETQLKKLRDEGFAIGEAQVYVGKERATTNAWWERLLSVHADDYYPGGGWTGVWPMDDGNPDTSEYWVVGVSPEGVAVWGAVQFYVSDPQNVWSWSEDMYVPSSGRNGGTIEKLCELVSPTVSAQSCAGGWGTARAILLSSFGNAAVGTGGALFWCAGAAIGYGGCLAGNFFGTFAASLIWNSATWYWGCR